MIKSFYFLLFILLLSACGQERTTDRTVTNYLKNTFWINNSVPVSQVDAQSLGKGTVLYFLPDGQMSVLSDSFYQEGDSIRLAEPKATPTAGHWQAEGRQVEVSVQNGEGVSEAATQGQLLGKDVFRLEDNLLLSEKDTFTLARNLEGRAKNFIKKRNH